MFQRKARSGFSMQIKGLQLNRPMLEDVAVELGITYRDVLFANGILTVYNTSKACQEIVDDGDLVSFVAMALDISKDDIADVQEVQEEIKPIDVGDFLDED